MAKKELTKEEAVKIIKRNKKIIKKKELKELAAEKRRLKEEAKEAKESKKSTFKNIKNKQTQKKAKVFNEYKLVTSLVKNYKASGKEEDLLEILSALDGIINSFTIMIAPSHHNQQIFFNPYMKKFLYLFLAPDERVNTNYSTYMQAVFRIRWIMRFFTYEDIHNLVVSILIDTVRKMKVIDGCDCIYYIQFIAKFKMQNEIVKQTKDASTNILTMPNNFNDSSENEEANEEVDRLHYCYKTFQNEEENKLLSKLYDDIDITVILRDDDVFKCLTYYEKYILYLLYILYYKEGDLKHILNILKYETPDELLERIEDIKYKLVLLNNEY